MQILPQIPPEAQPVGGDAHQLAFGPDALEEHDELELDAVNTMPSLKDSVPRLVA